MTTGIAAPPAPAEFRRVLGHVPTPVCVVTAVTPEGPVGVTVGSFASVSLDPPLVVFYAGAASATAAALTAAGRYCVNVLSDRQHELCAAFARRGTDRFAACAWEPGANGAPRLAGALAWIECELESALPAGDHVAVLGRVAALHAADERALPLVFHRGRLARLERAAVPHVPSHPFDWWDM